MLTGSLERPNGWLLIMCSRHSKTSVFSGLALTMIALAGCGNSVDLDSETVETQSLWVGAIFEAKGNGATSINVEINNGSSNGENIRLTANERLEVSGNGLTVILEEDTDLFDVDYEGQIETDAINTQLVLSFFRSDGSVINGSRVTLTGPFTITAPTPNQSAALGDFIAVQWTPAAGSGSINIQYTAQCSGFSFSQLRDVADNGLFVIDTGSIDGIRDPQVPTDNPCRFTIRLARDSRGVLDPAFRGGGFVRAVQERTVEMSLSLQ